MKASKAFIKPFETPQRSVKIKISVNFHFNTTFWNTQGEKGLEEFIFRDNRKSTTHVLDDLTIPTQNAYNSLKDLKWVYLNTKLL